MTPADVRRNSSLLVLLCAIGSLHTACTTPLVVGDQNDDPKPAIALAYEDLQGWLRPDPEEGSDTALYIQIDSQPIDCESQATIAPETCETGWHVAIALPAEYVQPGTYDLADPKIRATFLSGTQDGDLCASESGALTEGTVRVESIEVDDIVVRLETSALPEASGPYRATRC